MSKLRSLADPFLQDVAAPHSAVLNVLGVPITFESNVCWLVELAQQAFLGLPVLESTDVSKGASISVRMIANDDLPPHAFDEPPPPVLYGDDHAYILALSRADASYVNLSVGRALIMVSPALAHFAYNIRYELIEFAAYRLAANRLGAVGMHAACVAKDDASLVMFGETGAGKSTLALALMRQGWDLIGEDALFVLPRPRFMLRGAPNFIHLPQDAQRAIGMAHLTGNVIQRRSGWSKLEIDVRALCTPLRVEAPPGNLIFVEADGAGDGPQLTPVDRERVRQLLIQLQPFAARQMRWPDVLELLLARPAFRLRRGNVEDAVTVLTRFAGG